MPTSPVVRLSKGHFAPDRYAEVNRLITASEMPLVPAIKALSGLISYWAAVDPVTNTVINASIWTDLRAAKQMETLAPMLAQRPVLEGAGVRFDRIANYEPLWEITTPERR